jgi:hypothetical protein
LPAEPGPRGHFQDPARLGNLKAGTDPEPLRLRPHFRLLLTELAANPEQPAP